MLSYGEDIVLANSIEFNQYFKLMAQGLIEGKCISSYMGAQNDP